MKRTGVIVARQLKKHNQPRLQTLAMRRIAAWQMASCPSDANGRRYREESVTWRCNETWRDEYIKPVDQHAMETPSSCQTELLGTSFHAFLW